MVSKTISFSKTEKDVNYVQENVGSVKRFIETVYLAPRLEPHHRSNETTKYRNNSKQKEFDNYGWYKNTIFCDPGWKPRSFGSTVTAFDALPEYCSSRVYIPIEDADRKYVYSITENFFTAQFGGGDITTTQIRAFNQHVTTVDHQKTMNSNSRRH